jgi:hypothetical protein
MHNRDGEGVHTQFRTQRFFCICGQWFFSTRKNLQVGPFQCRDDAEVQLMLFLRHVEESDIYANLPAPTDYQFRL